MKIIQSFWTGNKNSLTDSYGWLLPIFNYLSWIISCNQLRRYYDDVTLVTDSQGYDVLINKLHLPYTDVIVSLDCLNQAQFKSSVFKKSKKVRKKSRI